MEWHPGPERRIHKVYVTRNTEYHVRRGVCVAIRDRHTGTWLEKHAALRCRLGGSIRADEHGMTPHWGPPRVGDVILFCANGHHVLTSMIEAVERPSKDIVEQYPVRTKTLAHDEHSHHTDVSLLGVQLRP